MQVRPPREYASASLLHMHVPRPHTTSNYMPPFQDRMEFLRNDLTHLFDDQGIDQLRLCVGFCIYRRVHSHS